jgi:hypothetical protein
MNMNFKMNTKWTKITIILACMAGMSTLTFNCAPNMFMAAKGGSSDFSSMIGDIFNAPSNSPFVLMTARQTYKTMLNVTGQEGAQTTTQVAEFGARAASLSTNDKLSNVNAPLQMAATSLAGEVCNGLLTKEAAAPAANRKFFAQVDFTKPASGNSQAAFDAAVSTMASSFWNRQPTAEEQGTLDSFYSDFAASAGTAAAGTRNLYLGACTGMLGSFDTYTY